MSLIDKKRKIFGNVAAAKTLTESMPKLKLTSSFPSINNKGNSIELLTDLIRALIGYAALVNSVVDILIHSLDDIETDIKKALKVELKSIVSCGVDPSLPSFIKSTGPGIVIEVKKIDFFDIFKVDPTSPSGKLIYNDVTSPLSNSTDLNTFLYDVIQNEGVTKTWAGILDFTFTSLGSGTVPNNTFTIKANPAYDTKKLTDLNNDFVDSLKLFNTESIVNKIMDFIYGSISFSVSKSVKQLESEEKINRMVDKMVDLDSGDDICDSYFTFDNDEIAEIQRNADNRQKGVSILNTENNIDASVPEDMLTTLNVDMATQVTTQGKKDALSSNLDAMAEQTTANETNQQNKVSIKLNFFQNIITNLTKSIVSVVLSPKVVLIFLINYKIIYGSGSSYEDSLDFIKKNKQLIKAIIKKVSESIVKQLLKIALSKIGELVAAAQAKKQIDKNKNKLIQLLSLTGVPQQALRIIKGLS
jgi:hypothetical protein